MHVPTVVDITRPGTITQMTAVLITEPCQGTSGQRKHTNELEVISLRILSDAHLRVELMGVTSN